MKLLSVALISLAGLAMAKEHGKAANSTMAQCHEMARLTKLVDLANNQTKLDKVTHSNATKTDAIKAKASAAASKLSSLQSNPTLMASCSQVFAADDMRRSCFKMASLEGLNKLIANATALDDVTKHNTTKADKLKAKAAAEASTLSSMQSNATLTQFCSVVQTEETCRAMNHMQNMINQATNATWLNDRFKGNEAKINNFKDRASKAQTKLTSLQSNNTLTSACSAMGITGKAATPAGAAAASSTSAAASTSGMAKSGAGSLQPFAAMTSLVALLIVGILLL